MLESYSLVLVAKSDELSKEIKIKSINTFNVLNKI